MTFFTFSELHYIYPSVFHGSGQAVQAVVTLRQSSSLKFSHMKLVFREKIKVKYEPFLME
jgi:hypothetical protein